MGLIDRLKALFGGGGEDEQSAPMGTQPPPEPPAQPAPPSEPPPPQDPQQPR